MGCIVHGGTVVHDALELCGRWCMGVVPCIVHGKLWCI